MLMANGRQNVILAKSSLKTSADMGGMFDDQFFNVKTLNTVKQNKDGNPHPNDEDLFETEDQEAGVAEDQTEEEIEKSQREKQEQQLREKEENAVTTISRWYRKKKEARQTKDTENCIDQSFVEEGWVDNKSCGICGVHFADILKQKQEYWRQLQDGKSPEKNQDHLLNETRAEILSLVRKEHISTVEHQRNALELRKFIKTCQESIEPTLKEIKAFLYDSGFGLVDQSYVEKHYAQHQMDIQRLYTLLALIEKELQLKINSRMWSHAGLVESKLKELESNFRNLKPYIEQIQNKMRQEEEDRVNQAAATNIPSAENWEDEIEDIHVVVEEPRIVPRKGRAKNNKRRTR